MSFAQGFYSFSVDVTLADEGRAATFRIKLPLHPLETLQDFLARVLVYAVTYHEGLTVTGGPFHPEQPALMEQDLLGTVKRWIEVGLVPKGRLRKARRANPHARIATYFHTIGDLNSFCHELRGSESNWVKDMEFYMLDGQLLQSIAAVTTSSSKWQMTVGGDTIYLDANGTELSGSLVPVDIWAAFQVSLEMD